MFNPFNTNLTWANSNSSNLTNGGQSYANPFRTNEPPKANGVSYSFQPAVVPTMNGSAWSANPFKVIIAAEQIVQGVSNGLSLMGNL